MSELVALTPERKRFIRYWVLGIVVIYALVSLLVVDIIQGEKDNSNKNHILRMDPIAVEPGKTPPDPMPANNDFTPVHVGIYLDGIETVNIKESFWVPTFFIWFKWKGDAALDPGKHFRLVDGK